MRKIHKCYAQNAETLCSKYRKVMLKIQKNVMHKMWKGYPQNAETLCSKCRNAMLKMRKGYAQNAETLCSKYKNLMLKNRSLIRYTVRGQALIRELTQLPVGYILKDSINLKSPWLPDKCSDEYRQWQIAPHVQHESFHVSTTNLYTCCVCRR